MTTVHWMVLACIWGIRALHNRRYRWGCATWPIASLEIGGGREEDIRFQDLQLEVNTSKSAVKSRVTWISEGIWRLVERRTVLRRIELGGKWFN